MTFFETHGGRLATIALLACGLAIAMYFVGPALDASSHEAMRTAALKKELAEKQNLLANHDAFLTQLAELKTRIAQLQVRLPSDFDVPAIEADLRARALSARAEVESMTTGPEKRLEGFYSRLPIKLVVRGHAAPVIAYIDGLLREPRLSILQDFLVESDEDRTTVHATLHVLQFRRLEEE